MPKVAVTYNFLCQTYFNFISFFLFQQIAFYFYFFPFIFISWRLITLPFFFSGLISFILLLFFFSFIFVSWRLITLQYCSGFCHTLT